MQKSILDIQGRINAEQAMLQNDNTEAIYRLINFLTALENHKLNGVANKLEFGTGLNLK